MTLTIRSDSASRRVRWDPSYPGNVIV